MLERIDRGQFVELLDLRVVLERAAVDRLDRPQPRALRIRAGAHLAANQNSGPQLIFFDQRAGDEGIGLLSGVIFFNVAQEAVTLGMQFQHTLGGAGHFLSVRANGRAGTHLVLLHRPGASGAIVAVLVVREMTAPWATAAAAMLLAGSLVVVATLVRPTTTSTTPTATGHSIGVVIAASASPTASAVVRPVAPLRGLGPPNRHLLRQYRARSRRSGCPTA